MSVCLATSIAVLVHCAELARPGDRINVAPGTYGDFGLDRVRKAGMVTIQPLDPRNPPVFTGRFIIKGSSGFTFRGLRISVRIDMPVQAVGSSQIVFDGLDVGGLPNLGDKRLRGLLIRDSDHVTVRNSHFYDLQVGVGHHMTAFSTIADNVFERINVDGIDGGGGNDLTIDGNVFYNFDHVGGLHPDAIQVWTTFNTVPNRNFHITNNVFVRGSIGLAVQGINVGNEKNLPHVGLVVSDNVVIGANYNGIGMFAADNGLMERNLVLGVIDQKSWLAARNGSATVDDNAASMINFVPGVKVSERRNASTRVLTMGELGVLNQLVESVKPGQTQGFADVVRARALELLRLRMPAGGKSGGRPGGRPGRKQP